VGGVGLGVWWGSGAQHRDEAFLGAVAAGPERLGRDAELGGKPAQIVPFQPGGPDEFGVLGCDDTGRDGISQDEVGMPPPGRLRHRGQGIEVAGCVGGAEMP